MTKTGIYAGIYLRLRQVSMQVCMAKTDIYVTMYLGQGCLMSRI